MSQHMEDMNQVPDPGAVIPEGWYHVRIAKVEEATSENSGNPVVKLNLKIQNEGSEMGRVIADNASLQAHALFKLKAYYNAVGYKPAPGQGHDPDNLVDGELWVGVQHKIYEGVTRTDIASHMIKSLTEGPGKAFGTAKA